MRVAMAVPSERITKRLQIADTAMRVHLAKTILHSPMPDPSAWTIDVAGPSIGFRRAG